MNICYIVGAGDFYGKISPADGDLVIAADGGYDTLVKIGITPSLILGDLDSIASLPDGIELIRYPARKDETDMHLAYLEGYRRGYRSFKLYGGVGGRADHTFANYCLLSFIASQGAAAFLYGKGSVAYVIKNNTTRVMGRQGKHISVFAFGGDAKGVSIKGLEYELNGGILTPGLPLGVSNRFTGGEGEISVSDGSLLIISEI